MPAWTVYIIRAESGALYTGVTTDLDRRLAEHAAGGRGARFFRFSGPARVVYRERARDRSAAQSREAAIKRCTRAEKEALIRKARAAARAATRARKKSARKEVKHAKTKNMKKKAKKSRVSKKSAYTRKTLAEKLKAVNERNLHGETETGDPVGRSFSQGV